MKLFLAGLALSALSLLLPAASLAQAEAPPGPDAAAPPRDEASPPASSWDWDEDYPANPEDAAPLAQGEPPSAEATPNAQAPAEQPPAAAQAEVPPGQWVYTQQYGWIWMPYADSYTVVPSSGYGEPYMYVYCPAWGWSWLVAPWVWGYGPWPHFGVYGAVHFGWYSHGWWRTPHRWHWVPSAHGGGFRHGGFGAYPAPRGVPHRSFAPSPWRGGFDRGGRAAPAPRGGARTSVPGPMFRGAPGGRGSFGGGFTSHGGGVRPGTGWSGGSPFHGSGGGGWARGPGGGGRGAWARGSTGSFGGGGRGGGSHHFGRR